MAETWRVVLASGEVRSYTTERVDYPGEPSLWRARGEGWRAPGAYALTERAAVCAAASTVPASDLVEILAPGELARAEILAGVEAYAAQLAPMARVVDVLRAAAVAAGHPAADGDPDAQLRAVRAQAFREGAETMRGAVVQDPHMVLSDYDERRIRALPVPPCPEVSR